MAVPTPGKPSQAGWETIKYALDSKERTVRLCISMTVFSIAFYVPPALLVLAIHLLMRR
jgi:hypothetical protein